MRSGRPCPDPWSGRRRLHVFWRQRAEPGIYQAHRCREVPQPIAASRANLHVIRDRPRTRFREFLIQIRLQRSFIQTFHSSPPYLERYRFSNSAAARASSVPTDAGFSASASASSLYEKPVWRSSNNRA